MCSLKMNTESFIICRWDYNNVAWQPYSMVGTNKYYFKRSQIYHQVTIARYIYIFIKRKKKGKLISCTSSSWYPLSLLFFWAWVPYILFSALLIRGVKTRDMIKSRLFNAQNKTKVNKINHIIIIFLFIYCESISLIGVNF